MNLFISFVHHFTKMMSMDLKNCAFLILFAFLILCADFGACYARNSMPWRQSRIHLSSVMDKGHSSHHNHKKHNTPLAPAPAPKPKPKPPAPMPVPAPAPKPKPKPPAPAPMPVPAPLAPAPSHKNSTTFNVQDYGAKGDGQTDDMKAFLAAWAAACKVEASTILVPSGSIFLLSPISFAGPNCKPKIIFQLDGKIIAPTSAKAWGSGFLQWIEFTKLTEITIKGEGIIDGQGSVWWKDAAVYAGTDTSQNIPSTGQNRANELNNMISAELSKMPKTKPTALRFYGSTDVTVTGITIQNSPKMHLKFDSCTNVHVFDISVSSPGDSPNTDGIHLQNSQNVLIHSCNLACGDDCVSIQTGCSNIYIHDINCGPGHGISIGGLGNGNTRACVSNVTVRNTVMRNTMTGVRIKTLQGGSGSANNIMFSNIQVSEVETPIVIDQYYCDKEKCKNQTSAVAVSGITYANIQGTYTVQPVYFACSDNSPCTEISLATIQLKPHQTSHHLYGPFCWKTYGESKTSTVPPIDCLQKGNPSNAPSKIASCQV
ncbi:polygalacturonase At1g48100-like isoform X2 [Rhodamnia argentea]|uniref:Polygalacturonase At1g48100-like isoform X2 n=1 Tax=Rhodamnia argentea TaxID=178133 RepID=A0ABM3HTS9_9MYRT|nr:polygalacturonase At1g48100-like isoform X2 [Rhodamnia argentea]